MYLLVEFNHRLDSVLEQFLDQLLNRHETRLTSDDHHDSYPFDRKFYRLAFEVCFHLQVVVVDPRNYND